MGTKPIEWIAPRIFAGLGLLLVVLACYMTGADSLACRRNGDRVDCRVARSRLLGLITVEQLAVPDVVDAWVRTSTSSQQTYRSGRGSNADHTSSHDTLILHTRDSRDIATLGGDQSASYADQVIAIVKESAHRAADPGRAGVTVEDELREFTIQDWSRVMSKDIVAYGIYPNRESFDRALESLRAAGFRNSDVSAILPERDVTNKDLAHEIHTKAPEGTTTGVVAGGAAGGILGWLVGVGALAIPGVGPLVAAGPVVAALAAAGAVGATGGLVGALIGAGIPEVEAKRYAGRIREGGYLISVHCDDSKWAKKAEEILEATGGRQVVKTSEASADYRP